MKKKILGVAGLFILLSSFTPMPNIPEVEDAIETETVEHTQTEISEPSFTPESEENTIVMKKEVIRVESPCEVEQEEMETEIENCQNRWNITLTQEEKVLLAKIVWLEARGEPIEGQQAVIEVIFNRMASELYPNTLYEVLSQSNPVQFCSFCKRDSATPTEKEYQSIEDVLAGKTAILRNDTTYFSTFPLTKNVEKQIGGHYFCFPEY